MTLLDIILHNSIRFLVLIAIFMGLDWYCWHSIVSHYKQLGRWFSVVYLIEVIVMIIILVLAVSMFIKSAGISSSLLNFLMSVLFLLLIPKLGFALVMGANDIGRAIWALLKLLISLGTQRSFPLRSSVAFYVGFGFAGLLFLSGIHGILWGRTNFTVHRQEVFIENLPENFDGFTITQLSDMHLGSFASVADVQKGLTLANEQKSDILVFTGDMVNTQAQEARPYLSVLSSLSAPLGKYAILGNHDYGDYYKWENQQAKYTNLKTLKELEAQSGFKMLNNSAVEISRGGQSIYLAGVENWGQPPFPKYGNLRKAMQGIPSGSPVVLLSHDPSHWTAEVVSHPQIALTLSGHTHGMQFGIETPWFKFSPAQFKYPHWAGLYTAGKQSLYVNRGFGFVAFPCRVGIYPEVTVLVLRTAK